MTFIKRRKVLVSLVAATLVIVAVAVSVGGNGKVETVSAQTIDLVRTVKISGKVVPDERVDMGFEISGTIATADKPVGSAVYKGETLATLSSGGIAADLQRAEADLASAQAELNKLEGTEVYENSITNAKRSIVRAILDAYSAATEAVLSDTDQVFYNANSKSTTPILLGGLSGYVDLRRSVEEGRMNIGTLLEDWQELVTGLSSSSATYSQAQLALSKQYLAQVTAFVSSVSQAVNLFEVSGGVTQDDIDTYKSAVSSAREGLSIANKGFIDAENALAALLSDVPVQVARVEAASASASNLRYQLGKTRLVSPLSGIVAKQDAKPGQAALSGANVVSVISKENVIETFVPEVSIVGIKVGDSARVTLDAYGPQTSFEARVVSIDPAETIRDGVSTYKTELAFVTPDERIRSGMTANVEIETFRKPNSTLIPDRTVVREEGGAYVYIVNGDGEKEKRSVTLGERDSRGNVEVLSGVTESDKIVVNPKD